jgi:dolichol kinase
VGLGSILNILSVQQSIGMNWIKILVLVIFPYLLFFVAYWMRDSGKPFWSIRKLIHSIGLSIVGVYGAFLDTLEDIFIVLILFLIVMGILTAIPSIRMFFALIEMGTRQGEKEIESMINTSLTSLSMIILLVVMFDTKWIFLAGVLSVGLGDGLGEFIGKPYGKHKSQIFAPKSVEGSLAVFVGTLIGIFASFLSLSSQSLDMKLIFIFILTSIIAMTIEALSISFMDNVLMPWAVTGMLWYL